MAESEEKNNKENIFLLKLLWSQLPKNIRRFFIVVLIVLVLSTFFVIIYFDDAFKELIWLSNQIDNATR